MRHIHYIQLITFLLPQHFFLKSCVCLEHFFSSFNKNFFQQICPKIKRTRQINIKCRSDPQRPSMVRRFIDDPLMVTFYWSLGYWRSSRKSDQVLDDGEDRRSVDWSTYGLVQHSMRSDIVLIPDVWNILSIDQWKA